MKIVRLILFLVVALLQLSVPASAVWKRSQTLRHGRVWKFKTAPVDPVDVVRGRYIALRFTAEEFDRSEEFKSGNKQVYAVLKKGAGDFAEVDHLTAEQSPADDVVPVDYVWWNNGKQRVRFRFDKFWIAETNAAAAEKAYVEASRRGKENAYVTVRVRNGDAALEQLYIDNQPLTKYLRGQNTKK